MWSRATPEQIIYFSKATDYRRDFNRLKEIYGE